MDLQEEEEDDGLQAAVRHAPGLHALQLLEKEEAVHLVRRVHDAVQQQAGEEVFILEKGRTCTGLMVSTALKLASRPPQPALASGILRPWGPFSEPLPMSWLDCSHAFLTCLQRSCALS